MPFEVPEGWVWVKMLDISISELGKTLNTEKNTGTPYNYLCTSNVRWNSFDLSVVKKLLLEDDELERYKVQKGDLLICEGGDVGRAAIWEKDDDIYYQNALHRVRFMDAINQYFYLHVLHYYKLLGIIDDVSGGVTIKHFTQNSIKKLYFPLPPLAEQDRIVSAIEQWFTLINILEDAKGDLQNLISQAKSKILDLATHGKLVPQDANDEPAIELLKRINPKFTPCDIEHYPQLPAGWCIAPMKLLCSLEDGRKEENIERFNIDVKFLRGEQEAKTINNGRYIVANSLLILVDGENSGEVFRTPIDGYQGSTFKRLVINENMCEEYLLYVISSHRKALRENKVGSAIPHLNKKLFKGIEVTIPPVNEQRRIVKSIKTLFNYIDNIAENL